MSARTAVIVNKEYTDELKVYFHTLPKRILARYTIKAYQAALKYTVQDSGRAAYNWHLKIGSAAAFNVADWYQQPNPHFKGSMRYAKPGQERPGHPVGFPGERRGQSDSRRRIVIDYKLSQIDFPNRTYGAPMGVSYNQTKLYTYITGGASGGSTVSAGQGKKITLYNPIWRSGNPGYIDNAFRGHSTQSAGRGGNVAKQIDHALNQAKRAMKITLAHEKIPHKRG